MPIVIDSRETRPEILALAARAKADAGSDEAYFLRQLRAALAGLNGPTAPFALRVRGPRFRSED